MENAIIITVDLVGSALGNDEVDEIRLDPGECQKYAIEDVKLYRYLS